MYDPHQKNIVASLVSLMWVLLSTVLPSQDGSNQECTCDKTNKARLRACENKWVFDGTACTIHLWYSKCVFACIACSQLQVKIKVNKQGSSPWSELNQGSTQRETANRLISLWPLLLGVVSFFFPTLPPSETSIQDCRLSLWGFCNFYCFEKISVA